MTKFCMSVRNRVSLRLGCALVAGGFLWWGSSIPVVGQSAFPPRLDDYFTKVLKLSAQERKVLLAGAPLAKNLDADPGKEVAIFGAIWIAAPIATYVAAVRDIENFEKGDSFRVTKKVSEPARIEDFAQLALPDDDVRDMKSCKVGDCELKLSDAMRWLA